MIECKHPEIVMEEIFIRKNASENNEASTAKTQEHLVRKSTIMRGNTVDKYMRMTTLTAAQIQWNKTIEFLRRDQFEKFDLRINLAPRSWASFFKKDFTLVINERIALKSKDKVPFKSEFWFKKENLVERKDQSPFQKQSIFKNFKN